MKVYTNTIMNDALSQYEQLYTGFIHNINFINISGLFDLMNLGFSQSPEGLILFVKNGTFLVNPDAIGLTQEGYDLSYLEYINNEVYLNEYFCDLNWNIGCPIEIGLILGKKILLSRASKLKSLFPSYNFHLVMIYQNDDISGIKLKFYMSRDTMVPLIDSSKIEDADGGLYLIEL